MRHLLLPALAAALFCTGCFDYTEELWLEADGSARLHSVMAMADIASGFGSDGNLPFGADKEFEDGSGKVWTERVDGNVLTHIEAEVADFRKSGTLAPGDKPLGKLSPDWYTVEPLGFGRYRLLRTVGFPDGVNADAEAADDNPLGAMGGAVGRSIMDQVLEGHEFKVTLHAPLIISSNADVKLGMTGAVWQREMTALSGEPFTLEATVLLLDYTLAGIAAGGVLLLILVIGLAARRKRALRHQAGAGMPTSVDAPGAGL